MVTWHKNITTHKHGKVSTKADVYSFAFSEEDSANKFIKFVSISIAVPTIVHNVMLYKEK